MCVRARWMISSVNIALPDRYIYYFVLPFFSIPHSIRIHSNGVSISFAKIRTVNVRVWRFVRVINCLTWLTDDESISRSLIYRLKRVIKRRYGVFRRCVRMPHWFPAGHSCDASGDLAVMIANVVTQTPDDNCAVCTGICWNHCCARRKKNIEKNKALLVSPWRLNAF